jgi:hypothetical protein
MGLRMRNARKRVVLQKKTAVSPVHHCSLAIKRLVKHFESDGFGRGAGDGARTRDSLLGRQVVTYLSLAWHNQPSQAD